MRPFFNGKRFAIRYGANLKVFAVFHHANLTIKANAVEGAAVAVNLFGRGNSKTFTDNNGVLTGLRVGRASCYSKTKSKNEPFQRC